MQVFSEVLLFAAKKKADYLQGGEVHNLEDVMKSTKGINFIKKFPAGTKVHGETILFHYGEDKKYEANSVELSFFEKKRKENVNFLGRKAECISANVFDEDITDEILALIPKKNKKEDKNV